MTKLDKTKWKKVQLGEIAKIIGGGTPSRKKSEYWNGTVPWLTTSDLSDYPHKYIKKGKENITKLGLKNSSAKLLPSGSILYSSRASIGYIAIAKNPIATSQGFKNFVPKPNQINRDYLYYALKYYTPLIEQIASGATYKEISGSELKNIEINLPTFAEQKKISSYLSDIDNFIEVNIEKIKILEEIAQNLYDEWFVNFRYPGHEKDEMVETDYGLKPKKWHIGSLSTILENVKEKEKAGKHLHHLAYVPIDCISRKSLFLKEVKSGKKAKSSLIQFRKYDILFGAMRSYFHKVAIALMDGITRTTCFVLRPKGSLNYCYVVMSLFQESTVKYANSRSKGSTIPYAVWNNGLADMPIVIPDKDTLNSFNALVMPFFEEFIAIHSKIKVLTEMRNILLPKFISGAIDVSKIDN